MKPKADRSRATESGQVHVLPTRRELGDNDKNLRPAARPFYMAIVPQLKEVLLKAVQSGGAAKRPNYTIC